MSRTRITHSVGCFVIEDSDDDTRFYYEQDYGSNPYGDVGLYYRNTSADKRGSENYCYIAAVPGGVIELNDPDLPKYAYTYDNVLEICNGNEAFAECVLELALGQSIEAIYDELKE